MINILSADIGGTNSRFAHFTHSQALGLALKDTCWLNTTDARSFPDLLQMLGQARPNMSPEGFDVTCIAIAGPVSRRGTFAAPPFISWDIDLHKAGLKRAVMINDFVAQAYACLSPAGRAAMEILAGEPDVEGAVAVIGGGTGLGMSALIPDGKGGYVAMPSEGGHGAVAFIDPEECALQQCMQAALGPRFITGNDVLTGRGLQMLHRCLTGQALSPQEVSARALQHETPTLVQAARLYGRACRDLALTTLSTGGLFIAGGVVAKNPLLVQHEAFAQEFHDSPKHSSILRRIPVKLITDEQSGLWGAAQRGLMELGH